MQALVETGLMLALYNLGGGEIILFLALVLILFWHRNLPDIARMFRDETTRMKDGIDEQASKAGQSLGGIYGKPAGEALTSDNQVADKLERAAPAARAALLRIPLDNIDRWLAHGHTAPHRLERWRQIIWHAQESPEGFQAMLALLRDREEEAGRLKDFAPFAGVLTREERHQAAPACAYNF